ncbi:hypothetical protein [Fictibacillus sp. NRS-1165]|uniref:hypothetical protein n=1 Tax=Fictibacillus sp. NRS-1165 TaxID=3144463 RepID=UPI003D24834B
MSYQSYNKEEVKVMQDYKEYIHKTTGHVVRLFGLQPNGFYKVQELDWVSGREYKDAYFISKGNLEKWKENFMCEDDSYISFHLKFNKGEIRKIMRDKGMTDLSVKELMEQVDEILIESAADQVWYEIGYIAENRKEYDV